ncbi:O-acyltransferase like protein-like [Neocloeon triangulifer]|uniref:O-acyltransferase like protein-like n=1 Tax=Neocloeon triangulifer TaxID=2078957 RepID=UPI00286F3DD6|nr:O-acyltransferase like protein-like [Neocloeon triangulifer]
MAVFLLVLLAAGNVVSADCPQDVQAYKAAVANGEAWAIQMLDASIVFPDGLMYAPGPRLGHFEQCLSAPSAPNYCLVGYQMNAIPRYQRVILRRKETLPAATVQVAACVPSSCDAAGAVEVAAFNLQGVLDRYGGQLKQSFCYIEDQFDGKAIAFVAVSVALISATFLASFTEKIPWLSARHNLIELFRQPPRTSIHCVHGVRCLSIAWVMVGHKFYTQSLVAPPAPSGPEAALPWFTAIGWNAYLSVDTFLLVSAMLSARAIAKFRRLPLVPFYLLRILRLWPALAAVVFFYACASTLVARGPLWAPHVQTEAQFCRDRWWSTLIFLNNYIDVDVNPCLSFSWYLSIDMQLAWLSPLVLFPLLKWQKKGVIWTLVLLSATIITIFTLTMVYNLPWTMSLLAKGDKIVLFWDLVYTNTPLRSQPYLIGLLLGFFIERPFKRISDKIIAVGWAASLGCFFGVVFSVLLDLVGVLADSSVAAAFYSSTHRILWSCSLSWLIFACHKGFGGPINKFLSLKVWVPLSRLTYCVFLTHLSYMTMLAAAHKAESQFTFYDVILGYYGDIALVWLPALLLHLTVEAPMSGLVKILANKLQ